MSTHGKELDNSHSLDILGGAYYRKPIEPPMPREEVEKLYFSNSQVGTGAKNFRTGKRKLYA